MAAKAAPERRGTCGGWLSGQEDYIAKLGSECIVEEEECLIEVKERCRVLLLWRQPEDGSWQSCAKIGTENPDSGFNPTNIIPGLMRLDTIRQCIRYLRY